MSLTLPYSFPKAPSEEPGILVSRESQLSRNLDLANDWVSVSPTATSEPYVKIYSSSNTPEPLGVPTDDPLDDILAESHREIEAYSLCLSHEATPPVLPKIRSKPKTGALLLRKRSRTVLEHMSQRQLDNSSNMATLSGINKTPTRSSIRVISSAKKAKSDFRDFTPTDSLARRKILHDADTEDEHSVVDPLACHADNIMRMAMDSTMLGSFYNNSFSSTFSNLADDSIAGRKYADILDCDKSIPDCKGPVLAKLRAQKIEISAEELQNAVNDLLR